MGRDPSTTIPIQAATSTGGERQDDSAKPEPRKRSEPERVEPPSDQPPIPREDSNPGNPRPADR